MPVYCCSSNDTPERLARRIGVPWEQIRTLNALDDPHRLTEGLSLFLPEKPPPRRELELLGCAYEPLPVSVWNGLLPDLSWWAGDKVPAADSGVLPLLLRANWDSDGNWSAETAHALLTNSQTPDSLCGAVEAGGFHGLYLLLAGLYAFDAPVLAVLVEALATALHAAGRYLLLGLDLEEEAFFPCARAADRVVLLSPCRMPAGPLPSPCGPLDRTAARLERAAKLLPSERLLLGLSGYGSLWRSRRAESLPHLAAVHLAAASGAPIRWDALSGECSFRCLDALGQPCTIWFQDLRSLQARLELLEHFGLAGLALQPTPRPNRPWWELLHSRYDIKLIAS